MMSLIGYAATLFLAVSLLVKTDLQFRWFNTLGCTSFIVYGVLINAFPVILTNTLLLAINAFYLVKIYRYRTEEDFDLVHFETDDQLVKKFLSFYKKDINNYFPRFTEPSPSDIRFMVLRDMAIANVFVASLSDDGTAFVRINYTVPKYRDYKVGKFIFDKEKNYLISQNIKEVAYDKVDNPQHAQFLSRMGFIETAGDATKTYSKALI